MDDLYATLQPVVSAAGLELVDAELRPGLLLVTVDRDGGVDLDALTEANRAVSSLLDELDPIPGRYALEVSSPGLERPLRTPAQFARAAGEAISVKTRPEVEGGGRLRGRLVSADEDGFELAVDDGREGPTRSVRLGYSDVDRARTVFEWGPAPRPGARRQQGGQQGGGGRTSTAGNRSTVGKKRKQVASR